MKCACLMTSLSRMGGGLFPLVRGLDMALHRQGVGMTVLGVADKHTKGDLPAWTPLDVRVFDSWPPRAFAFAPDYGLQLDHLDVDIAHRHGLWQYPSLACLRWSRLHNKPYLVSPQGMLDPWALSNARWKKRVVAACFENAHLRRAACLHAVCQSEIDSIRAYGLSNPVCLIPNGVDPVDNTVTSGTPPWADTVEKGSPVLLFLGRLHPKKGLSPLLDAWATVLRTDPGAREWTVVVAGWDQGGHLARLRAQATALNIQERVRFIGGLFGANKTAAMQHATGFILPSFSEGMPSAILEAWAHGLPVLMTRACNIPEGFDAGAAIEIKTNAGGIACGLRDMIRASAAERKAMGRQGATLVQERFSWDVLGAQMKAVYTWLLGGGASPACVRMP